MLSIRPHRALLIALATIAVSAPALAGLRSVKVPFVKNEWTEVGLMQDRIHVLSYRISLATNVSMNPLKVGAGPAMFFNVKNEGDAPTDFSLAVALFDVEGSLVGAATGSHAGKLEPGESKEVKIIFRDVNERVPDAATAQVTLETRL